MARVAATALALCLATSAMADPASDVLTLINAARAKAGCAALVTNPALTAAARGHSAAMARQDFFSHTAPGGSTVATRVKAQGYRFALVGENIAAGQADAPAAVRAWMASKGHRANILTCQFSETGIAMTYQADDKPLSGQSFSMKYYWVQVFGQPR